MQTSTKNLAVTLRPFQPQDEAFVYSVYVSTRAQEMALVPWDEEQREAFLKMQFTAQMKDYGTRYRDAVHSVIYLDDLPVGRLYVAELKDQIKILDVTLLPPYRGKGIGWHVINNLIARSVIAAKPLLIYVETYNPSVRFFERAGFSMMREEGVNFLMEWSPSANQEQ